MEPVLYKHYGFVIYGLCSKLVVYLLKLVCLLESEDTSLLSSLSISWKLQIRNALWYWPLDLEGLISQLSNRKIGIFLNTFLQSLQAKKNAGNTKGGSITVLLTSCLTGLESAVWQLTIFVFICKTD